MPDFCCFGCLNQPIEMDMSDKSAGIILDHQLKQVGYTERLVHSTISVFSIVVILRFGLAHTAYL